MFKSLTFNKLKRNVYAMTVVRLLVIFLLFSISRVLFFGLNYSIFKEISFSHFLVLLLSGLKFDLTAILYTNILFILMMLLPFRFRYNGYYQGVAKWIFLITNSVALMANLIDIVYFRYTMRRTDFGVFKEFGNDTNIPKILLKSFAENWYLILIFVGLVYVMYRAYGKMKQSNSLANPIAYYPTATVLMMVSFWLVVCGMRGGFDRTTRPLAINNAGENVNQPIETAIVLNTPFSIYRTIHRSTFKKLNFYPENELESIYTPIHNAPKTGNFKKLNVVILIVESFSKENSGYFNKQFNGKHYSGYTPFLDSLVQVSKTWQYSFANGVKSIDAIPSILGGVPSLAQPFVLSRYSLNKIDGLASILKKEGYNTSFFHGAPNGSMGFTAITNMLGFDHYYGKNEYGNDQDFDGYWGIRDEEFLQFYANKISTFPEPFLASVFTLSSHEPYFIPKKYENIFKGNKIPLHKAIQYTDYSLKRFFQTAAHTKWFKNTLFVLTADHSLPSFENQEYQSSTGVFSIPIVFYQPGSNLAGTDSTSLIQQIDIMPTILGYLKYPKPFFAFGRNHFDNAQKPFIANFLNGVYQFLDGDYVIHSDGAKLLGVFNYKKDPLLKENLLAKNLPEADLAFIHFKAFFQQYCNRMINDNLRINK